MSDGFDQSQWLRVVRCRFRIFFGKSASSDWKTRFSRGFVLAFDSPRSFLAEFNLPGDSCAPAGTYDFGWIGETLDAARTVGAESRGLSLMHAYSVIVPPGGSEANNNE